MRIGAILIENLTYLFGLKLEGLAMAVWDSGYLEDETACQKLPAPYAEGFRQALEGNVQTLGSAQRLF